MTEDSKNDKKEDSKGGAIFNIAAGVALGFWVWSKRPEGYRDLADITRLSLQEDAWVFRENAFYIAIAVVVGLVLYGLSKL